MAKKSALEKIEAHEKLCRIMQKQTFEQIKELKDKINRLEKILLGTAAFIIVSLIEKVI
jgi:protein-arginine kinase activator protein McsA